MKKLIETVIYIVNRSVELKNTYSHESSAPLDFACIFCKSGEEYNEFSNSIEKLGKIVERTPSGFTYLLEKPITTVAGPLRLIKIRKPDIKRIERGDADFNTDYHKLKQKYLHDPKFELIKYNTFEMLRLSSDDYDVMACFSDTPKSKVLGIKL